jgi:uncharacterized protein YraI
MRSLLFINGMSLVLAAIVLPAAAASPEAIPAASGRMVVSWTTWMHAAPSEQARTIDEIGTGTPVQVEACADGWCRVREDRADGYVEQRYLAISTMPVQRAAGPCFPAQYYTAEGPLGLTICPAVPAGK